jgi:hypothetical protein
MNQMVANLYTNNTGTVSSAPGNSNAEMTTTAKPDEQQQQQKRKESSEKSSKKVKRKKPMESGMSDDIDGMIDLFSFDELQLICLP